MPSQKCAESPFRCATITHKCSRGQ